MKKLIALFVFSFITGSLALTNSSPLPEPSWSKLPCWRGFNLLEKFSKGWSNGKFKEEDFKLISSLGFNFVRLPMDYRTWIKDGNILKFDEAVMKEIDQAVEWGVKYDIHVCINFHRAPGYTVNSPKEPKDLWTDRGIQKVCAKHWAYFAKRYKNIPNRNLSFNLFNEPSGIDSRTYAKVVEIMVKAVRGEDPDRLIIADGLNYGRIPVPELIPLKIAQATRGYEPFGLTHYKASWVQGSDQWPLPVWPPNRINNMIYGPLKPDFQTAWAFNGNFPKKTVLTVHVDIVSTASRLVVKADGKIVGEKIFTPGPGEGEWKRVDFKPEWGIYQNVYDRDYSFELPDQAKQIEISNIEGDWLNFKSIKISLPGERGTKEFTMLPSNFDWGVRQSAIAFDPAGGEAPFKSSESYDGTALWNELYKPWKDLEAQGVGVMVGEWGAFNRTPHDVVLRWMKDLLAVWKDAGWGWALWNFDGSFGILDSGRSDTAYGELEGRKVDNAMLGLLQSR